jgi:hypothetical protein
VSKRRAKTEREREKKFQKRGHAERFLSSEERKKGTTREEEEE